MPSDHQFLWWDLFLVTPLALTMVWVKSTDKLSKEKPLSSLLSKRNIVVVFTQVIIQFVAQILIVVGVKHRGFYLEVSVEEYQN